MRNKSNILNLEKIAKTIRIHVLKSISKAGSGHTGGSLGLADILSALYFHVLKHKPKQAEWEERDRFVLSIGHVAPLLYATLAEAGYFEVEELMSLRKLGSRLQGHPGRDHGLPGLELSAGSLGQGLSVAVGMALANRLDQKTNKVFCLMGDGELQEGSVWEAAMSAGHYKLDKLIGIVDRNQLQIDGKTEDVMQLEPLKQKWESFNWEVLECNGNDMQEVIDTFEKAILIKGKPILILAHTAMGKGVPSIEGNYQWHGKAPSEKELKQFLTELENTL